MQFKPVPLFNEMALPSYQKLQQITEDGKIRFSSMTALESSRYDSKTIRYVQTATTNRVLEMTKCRHHSAMQW
jgi:hypothetical protein